ncbi:MAG: hypothetical protein KDD78_15075 [Caldilineaceae bacterium]|nr:hypothetical protein [Caldilineaceae bacterium]
MLGGDQVSTNTIVVTLPDSFINDASQNQIIFDNTCNSPNGYWWGVRNVSIATPAQPTSTPPPVTGSTCLNSGPVALYRFEEGGGSTVTDVSGNRMPLNLSVFGNTTWISGGGLKNNGSSTIISSGAATKVINGVKTNNVISVEVWVRPANTTQNGPARIAGISLNPNRPQLHLGAGYNQV